MAASSASVILVSRRVEHGDARPVATTPQSIHDRRRSPRSGLGNSRLQVVTLLEIDVDEVVASHRAAQGTGASPDVEPGQPRHPSRFRHQPVGDLLEVPQLLGEPRGQVARVRSTHCTAPEFCVRDGTSTHHGLTKNRRCLARCSSMETSLRRDVASTSTGPGCRPTCNLTGPAAPYPPVIHCRARRSRAGKPSGTDQYGLQRWMATPPGVAERADASNAAGLCCSGRLTALPAACAALCHEVARATPILARAMRFRSVPAEAVSTERDRLGSGGKSWSRSRSTARL